ncbi:conjugative transfer signal peptidase TraF [Phyllobacterium phragmitis]|uniref:Conjugative transfer signal peptidase TraF n=1 Tax=Phyllobacterium phragmitis TaxID=2670329 RepID=A0A2S9ISP9_9HYPH|nr:conjugative transfer signal peptidase TraF [Phyllobacterium phragmitis]PRD43557.1 conjugative transfer signal peptidase TraF [Phyllobacterium phragmitis]
MRRRKALAIVTVSAVGLAGIAAGGWLGGYRINFTPSYPLGLWRVETLDREVKVGDRIFICPPRIQDFVMARERGYVRTGLCPGWLSPLIKSVVAGPGQRVDIGRSIEIDGKALARSEVRSLDAQGRALEPYDGGIVPPDHLFLHSEFAGSYDSRYFGPIPADGVLGLARPVFTFDP